MAAMSGAGFLALADAQPTLARRMRGAAMACLGAGGGLIRSDLRAVRGTDICRQSGGVIVQVHGRRPRVVPVLARYHAPLLAAAAFAGECLLTGGTGPARHNISNPLTRSLAGGSGLPPLEGSRLRATWLADCAQLIGLPVFLHTAGITCCQRRRRGTQPHQARPPAQPARSHLSAGTDNARQAGPGQPVTPHGQDHRGSQSMSAASTQSP
jgi:hypothetical protein